MQITSEISTIEDIKILVDNFYNKVRIDNLLGPIFNGVVQNNWPVHLDKMYRFWQTVLLSEHTYYGSPFPPHAQLPVDSKHFDRWIELFNETLDEHFQGEKADEAKWRARKMADMFQSKIAYYKTKKSGPLL